MPDAASRHTRQGRYCIAVGKARPGPRSSASVPRASRRRRAQRSASALACAAARAAPCTALRRGGHNARRATRRRGYAGGGRSAPSSTICCWKCTLACEIAPRVSDGRQWRTQRTPHLGARSRRDLRVISADLSRLEVGEEGEHDVQALGELGVHGDVEDTAEDAHLPRSRRDRTEMGYARRQSGGGRMVGLLYSKLALGAISDQVCELGGDLGVGQSRRLEQLFELRRPDLHQRLDVGHRPRVCRATGPQRSLGAGEDGRGREWPVGAVGTVEGRGDAHSGRRAAACAGAGR